MEIIILLAIYLLPTIVVIFNDDKRSKGPTIVVNVFLGWMLIPWVIAFAMAVSKDDKTKYS